MSNIVPTPWAQRLMTALAASSVIAFSAVPHAQAAGAHAGPGPVARRWPMRPVSNLAGTLRGSTSRRSGCTGRVSTRGIIRFAFASPRNPG